MRRRAVVVLVEMRPPSAGLRLVEWLGDAKGVLKAEDTDRAGEVSLELEVEKPEDAACLAALVARRAMMETQATAGQVIVYGT